MVKGLYNNGEEEVLRAYFDANFTPPSTFYVGLFNDSVDALDDDAVMSDISTEPSDGSYARASLDPSTDFTYSFNSANNFQAIATNAQVTVDGVTSQDVDAWFIADASTGGTLLAAGSLSDTVQIPGGTSSVEITEVGVYLA